MPDILASAIALAGVVLSAILAWFAGTRSAKVELRKKQLDLFQLYAAKLVERRITVYPEFYELLSGLVQKLHLRSLSRQELREFSERVQSWDTKHSLFLSVRASNVCFGFRWAVARLVANDAAWTTDGRLMSYSDFGSIGAGAERMEILLKDDLGIVAVELEDNRKLESYEAIQHALDAGTAAQTKPRRGLKELLNWRTNR